MAVKAWQLVNYDGVMRVCFGNIPYRDDGGIVDIKHMLNGHTGNLCNQDTPEGVSYGRVDANHVEFHIQVVLLLHFHPKLIYPFLEVPSIADTQCHVHVC